MGERLKISLFIILFSLFLTSISKGEDIKINDIIQNSKKLDGSLVRIQGEAIGEEMNRGDYSWVNINDGSNAIGLWIKKEEAAKIEVYGNYDHKGDIVEVQGIINASCEEHDGDIDIHVKGISLKEKGYEVKRNISGTKIYLTIGIVIITFVFFGLSYRKIFEKF